MTQPETPAIGYTNLEERVVQNIMAFSPNLQDLALLGQGWYEAANSSVRAVARAVSPDLGHNLIGAVATVMAILSPQMKWEDTMVDAYALLKEEIQGVPQEHSFMGIGRNVQLARNYLHGTYEPKGPKVKAFALNLTDPWTKGPVTIDGRMARIVDLDPNRISKGSGAIERYNAASRAFVRVSSLLDLASPHGLQAGMWLMDRAQKGQKK